MQNTKVKNILIKQKKRLHKYVKELRFNSILEAFITALYIFAIAITIAFTPLFADLKFCLAAILLMLTVNIIFAISLILFVRYSRLEKHINNIEKSSCDRMQIQVKKIKFILQRHKGENISILGVVLTDITKKKYYYIYPYSFRDDHKFMYFPISDTRKNIKNSVVGNNIVFECYKNTNIVKLFEKPNG